MHQEEWPLDSVTAVATEDMGHATITLHGILTTMAYEALFLRASARRLSRLKLVLPGDLLIAATCRSLAEAAGRGAPAEDGPLVIAIEAPSSRASWVCHHAALLLEEGLATAQAAPLPLAKL